MPACLPCRRVLHGIHTLGASRAEWEGREREGRRAGRVWFTNTSQDLGVIS